MKRYPVLIPLIFLAALFNAGLLMQLRHDITTKSAERKAQVQEIHDRQQTIMDALHAELPATRPSGK